MKIKNLIILISLLSVVFSSFAQSEWIIKSEYLKRDVPVLAFSPGSYSGGQKYPLVYLLHGYSADYTQWSKTIDCQYLADKYDMIIVCPEGFTSFYVDSPYDKTSRYERFFFQELVHKVDAEFNIDKENIFISGLSMGGYGALHFLITYPGYFSTAGSTSGALVIDFEQSQKLSQLFWKNNRLNDDLRRLFGDKDTANWNKNSIINLIKENPDFNKTFIFDCGTEDVLYPANLELKLVADSLNIPTTFIFQPGNHDTNYWNKSIEHHFVFFNQQMRKK